jgi:hypothetical protein
MASVMKMKSSRKPKQLNHLIPSGILAAEFARRVHKVKAITNSAKVTDSIVGPLPPYPGKAEDILVILRR